MKKFNQVKLSLIYLVFVIQTLYVQVNCSLNLNFDKETNSALFLDVGHTNHSNEFLLNSPSNIRYFAVLEPNDAISLKSSFGPISVRETIYPSTIQNALFNSRYAAYHTFNSTLDEFWIKNKSNYNLNLVPAVTSEITVHLASTILERNNPILRILFYTNNINSGSDLHQQVNSSLNLNKTQANHTPTYPHQLCAIAKVTFNKNNINKNKNKLSQSSASTSYKSLTGSCPLSSSNEGACVAQIIIPPNWWPSVTLDQVPNSGTADEQVKKHQKTSKSNIKFNSIEVYYTAVYSDKCGKISNEDLNEFSNENRTQAKQEINTKHSHKTYLHKDVNSTNYLMNSLEINSDWMQNLNWQHNAFYVEYLGKVQLKPFSGTYEELTNDDIIRILIPQKPAHAENRITIPVCYRYHRNYPLFAFALRIRVKHGLRIIGAHLARRSSFKSTPSEFFQNLDLQEDVNLLDGSLKSTRQKRNRLLNEYNKINAAQNWELNVDLNNKKTQATITAFLKLDSKDQLHETTNESSSLSTNSEDQDDDELDDDLDEFDEDLLNLMPSTCNEVYSVLLEVDSKIIDHSDSGRIVWQLLYLTDFANNITPKTFEPSEQQVEKSDQTNSKLHSKYTQHLKHDFDRETSKLTCKLDIQKDEIVSIIALTKNRHLINTAILTGKQTIQMLRIFAISSAGKLGHITKQSNCASVDESVLKVSPSCTSLYLDGSETKSSNNATILIRYGTYTGTASFQVWMPKLPLELDVSDDVLNAVHKWRIPHLKYKHAHKSSSSNRIHYHGSSHHNHYNNHLNNLYQANNYYYKPMHLNEFNKQENISHIGCRTRYQQAYIEVYTKFYCSDENSSREWLLINRKYSFRVTDLVLPSLRLSRDNIAILRGNTIEGLNSGYVNLNVVSLISKQQLASKQIHVSDKYESIVALNVRLITGLQMQIRPERYSNLDLNMPVNLPILKQHSTHSLPKVTTWSVQSIVNNALTTLYQEGLLDIQLQFSDGKFFSLSDVTDSDYHLKVNNNDPNIIAYAKGLSISLPRIIALKNGENVKLDVNMFSPNQCVRKNNSPLQQSSIYVTVNMKNSENDHYHDHQLDSHLHPNAHTSTSSVYTNNHNKHVQQEVNPSLQNDAHDTNDQMSPAAQLNQIQFNSLYNPQLTVAQRNKLSTAVLTKQAWTNSEISIYTMLCVFGLTMVIFITACFVFAVRQHTTKANNEFTTVTTVKPNILDDLENRNSNFNSRLNKVFTGWFWLPTNSNAPFAKTNLKHYPSSLPNDQEEAIIFDANGNPIINSKVNIRLNPFLDKEQEIETCENISQTKSNRQSIISYPGSEISIQITANLMVNAIEQAKNELKKFEIKKFISPKKSIQLEQIKTPEPDTQAIKNMLDNCKAIVPMSDLDNNRQAFKQPPPIPPRRQATNRNLKFACNKKNGKPKHLPGSACRTNNSISPTFSSISLSSKESKNRLTSSPSTSSSFSSNCSSSISSPSSLTHPSCVTSSSSPFSSLNQTETMQQTKEIITQAKVGYKIPTTTVKSIVSLCKQKNSNEDKNSIKLLNNLLNNENKFTFCNDNEKPLLDNNQTTSQQQETGKHLITNPFLTNNEQLLSNNKDLNEAKISLIKTPIVPGYTKPPPIPNQDLPNIIENHKSNVLNNNLPENKSNDQLYSNTKAPPIPRHQAGQINKFKLNQINANDKKRIKVIPPASLMSLSLNNSNSIQMPDLIDEEEKFKNMNYLEILDYIENMKETSA